MATVSASAEKLAEIKSEDAKSTNEVTPAAEVQPTTVDTKATPEGAGATVQEPKEDEDRPFFDADEKEQALRAVRQGMCERVQVGDICIKFRVPLVSRVLLCRCKSPI